MATEKETDDDKRWTITIDGDPNDPETQQMAEMLQKFYQGSRVVIDEVRACDTCQHFSCVCEIKAQHHADCRFLRAATSAVSISCDTHDRDVCPFCDPCTCGAYGAEQ